MMVSHRPGALRCGSFFAETPRNLRPRAVQSHHYNAGSGIRTCTAILRPTTPVGPHRGHRIHGRVPFEVFKVRIPATPLRRHRTRPVRIEAKPAAQTLPWDAGCQVITVLVQYLYDQCTCLGPCRKEPPTVDSD